MFVVNKPQSDQIVLLQRYEDRIESTDESSRPGGDHESIKAQGLGGSGRY
jgi:hypothetical protein